MKNHIVLAFLLCAALVQDLLTRKIKNRFNLFSLAVSFFCVIWSKEIQIWDALAGFGSVFFWEYCFGESVQLGQEMQNLCGRLEF